MENSGAEPSIDQLFELAMQTERQAAKLYGAFAKMFAHVPGLDAFWRTMTSEESAHEKLLKDARGLLSPEQLQAPADEKMWRDATRIHRIFADDLTKSVETLDDAYELAHDIEFSEVNAIFRFLTSRWIPQEKKSNLIHGVIEKHLECLSSFGDKFGDRDWRKSIKRKNIVD